MSDQVAAGSAPGADELAEPLFLGNSSARVTGWRDPMLGVEAVTSGDGATSIAKGRQSVVLVRDPMKQHPPDRPNPPKRSVPEERNAQREAFRRSVHDLAAAVVSMRALAETLAEHLPTLVAVARSKCTDKEMHIPPRLLDALPAIPAEIVKLCEIANVSLRTLGKRGSGAPEIATRPRAAVGEVPPQRVGCDSRSILLVEDEENVRHVTSQTLAAHGYLVAAACDGAEALRLLRAQDFDLVLMDLRIPGMSGTDTAKRIREVEAGKGRRTRIVGLTASPLSEDRREAMRAGMDDVLVKPIEVAVLNSMLSRFADEQT